MNTHTPKHRANIHPHDVLALDLLADRINHKTIGRRRMPRHRAPWAVDQGSLNSAAYCAGPFYRPTHRKAV